MKNKAVRANNGGISRRKLLKTGSAAAVLAGFGSIAGKMAHAGTLSPATMDEVKEENDVARVLAFWLAATNGQADLKLPLTRDAVKKATGLVAVDGNKIDDAIKRVNANADKYEAMRTEYGKIADLLFGYAPGQCPRQLETLKKLADINPNG
jgi:hypothetical protein